jgi:hypothetical protein
MFKTKYLPWVVGAAAVLGLAAVVPVFAATGPTGSGMAGGWGGGHFGGMMGPRMAPGVFGTVSAIDVNGDVNTLTVTQMQRPNATTTPPVYTVDATGATVTKNGTSSTASAIAVGDKVMVQGTVSGTNVTATAIRDGMGPMMGGRGGFMGKGMGHGSTSSTPKVSPIQGNGEPVVGGKITAISGDSLTVTNASNVTYTIDVTSANIVKGGATTTVASLAVGDSVVAQGTVNGTSVTASSVIDQGGAPSASGSTGTTAPSSNPGFFGSIGNFFKHIFGF